MTSRFVLVALIGGLAVSLLPYTASAQQTQSTKLVFEIKNFETVTIPEITDNTDLGKEPENIKPVEAPAPILETPVPKPKNYIPPKVEGDERVYMQEPEIREYICPKMGQKNCNIFIAVLIAENGTHECTRDNRGLNRNGSIDVGLAQINWNPKNNSPYSIEQLQDCKFNLDIALKKYEARGFQPWYAYTKGSYKKFLKPTPTVASTIQ